LSVVFMHVDQLAQYMRVAQHVFEAFVDHVISHYTTKF
jgi:hypothetical protein